VPKIRLRPLYIFSHLLMNNHPIIRLYIIFISDCNKFPSVQIALLFIRRKMSGDDFRVIFSSSSTFRVKTSVPIRINLELLIL
jgi:hypothetical protein